jgi:hypothetical protein
VSRPILLLLLGFWLGLLVASWLLAPATFRIADRILADPPPEMSRRLAAVAEPDRRVVLRHLAAEVNRWMFGGWGAAQLALALAVVALTWRRPGAARWIALAALALVLVQSLWLVPLVRDLGRTVDFSARPLPADLAGRFGRLHGAYALLDLVKAALLSVLAWMAARS